MRRDVRSSIVKFVVAAVLLAGSGFMWYAAALFNDDRTGVGLSITAAIVLTGASVFFFLTGMRERRAGN